MAPKKGNKSSKQASKNVSRVASGAGTPVTQERQVSAAPAIVGVNFGQSFSSIAVINKEGLADLIANDDGERQIASALSFSGEEEYFGVPARVQLVRNAENTILAFRNLLGKTYDEVKSVKQPCNSAPIVDAGGVPGFTVQIKGSPVTLTAHQAAVRFLTTLLSYASDFLGRKISHSVLSVPSDFTPKQVEALTKAAEEAGIKVLQTIPESAAALTAYQSTITSDDSSASSSKPTDRNVVVLDVGGSSTTASVIAVRDGLFVPQSSVTDRNLGGEQFDAKLMDFFGKEFTKKTRVPLEESNARALMKLRLAVEVTKKSLSASTSAPCSVESLAEGMDFHGSVNRMRFDLLGASIYSKIVATVEKALEEAKVDPLQIQEVVLVGGSTRLPKLSEKLEDVFPESTISSELDPDEVVARGSALQALSLTQTYPDNAAEATRAATEESVLSPSFITKPIGLVVDGVFTQLVGDNSPLPLRRVVDVNVASGSSDVSVLLSLWEGEHSIKVEQPVKKAKAAGGFFSRASKDDEDESDDEPEEIRTAITKPTKQIGDLVVSVDAKPAAKGKLPPKVRVTIVVSAAGKGSATAVQLKSGAAQASLEF